jgi:hypothetical protein
LGLADSLAEAAAAFAGAAALGCAAATGALEEALWLSASHKHYSHRGGGGSSDRHSNSTNKYDNESHGSSSSSSSSHQHEPLPLFPCNFHGMLRRVLPTARKADAAAAVSGLHEPTPLRLTPPLAEEAAWLDMGVTFMAYPSWGDARTMLADAVAASCQRALAGPQDGGGGRAAHAAGSAASAAGSAAAAAAAAAARAEAGGSCVARGLAAARAAAAVACGDVAALASVVKTRTKEPSDINEVWDMRR